MAVPAGSLKELIQVFEMVPDFRIERHKKYTLPEILFLVLSATIGGMRSWDEIADFGEDNLNWLRKYFPYTYGVPSHDTLNRVLSLINYRAFEEGFITWASEGFVLPNGAVINIDGKKLRSSASKSEQQLPHSQGGKGAVHLVQAWCGDIQLCLGQSRVDNKSNEIVAIPELLNWLDVEGCVITIDAIGCQKEIAQQIVDKKADYVLGLKANQPKLQAEVTGMFESASVMDAVEQEPRDMKAESEQPAQGHGRIEKRVCRVLPAAFMDEDLLHGWKGLSSVIEITAYRHIQATGHFSLDKRYYISSLAPDAARLNEIIRLHWSIENQLHWALDVQFGEDQSRKQSQNAAANFGLMLRWALNLLKHKPDKISLKRKMNKCLWNEAYRELTLGI
jgi:predicted transposase YbfD/YdcC